MTDTPAVVERPGIELPARYGFGPDQQEAIRRTVAKDCTPEEFVMFLELAARYQLDPFARQIWAAKMGGENRPVSILVGRDGYLAIAERHPAFEGMDGDVVREGDNYEVVRGAIGPEVQHEYGERRGTIIGAWAIVWRSDRRVPTYFWAPLGDYKPTGPKLQHSPWGKQESVMMLKCAQSTALRLCFNISGFVPAEEAGFFEGAAAFNGAPVVNDDPGSFEWGEDEVLVAYLRALIDVANEVREGSFKPTRVRMLLRGKTDAQRRVLAREIVEFIARRGGTPPPDPFAEDVVEGDAEDVTEEPS